MIGREVTFLLPTGVSASFARDGYSPHHNMATLFYLVM